MNPDMQAVYQQMQQAQQHVMFIGYSTYAAIIICAIFSVLIFWKLCQIKSLLQSSPHTHSMKPAAQPASPFAAKPTSPRADDESRFMPK